MSRRIAYALFLILAAAAAGAGAIYFLNNRPLTVQIAAEENNAQI